MEVSLEVIKDSIIKKSIIEKCDKAFINGITTRENYRDIFNKIDKYAFLIAASVNNEYVGYAAIYANNIDSKIAYITMIGVLENMQGLHIGSKLMNRCIHISQENGMKWIRLEVLKDNSKALGFYEQYGFCFEREASKESYYLVLKL